MVPFLHLIRLSEIRPWQANPSQRTADGPAWREFVEHIATHGQLLPVVVVASPHGGYELVDGHRRVAALQELGRTSVLAIVSPLSFAEAIQVYGTAEQLKLAWSGRQVSELPVSLGWDLALAMMRPGYRRTFERALACVTDQQVIVQACQRWGPRAIQKALTLVTPDWPLDRILRVMLRHGAYRDLEDQVKGQRGEERKQAALALLARWEVERQDAAVTRCSGPRATQGAKKMSEHIDRTLEARDA